jgi:hypothetical protein
MQSHDSGHSRGITGHAARLAAAGVMATWFAWQLVLLGGHIPL